MIVSFLKEKRKRIFLRVDFNVKFKGNKILDDFKIQASKKTIDYLLKNNHKVILATHLGNPRGREKNLSTQKLIPFIEKIFKRKIFFGEDVIGPKVKEKIEKLKFGELLLLENLRFYKEEKENDKNFAKRLKELADFYVFEAFSVAHRKHASVYALPKMMENFYGFRAKEEVEVLSSLLKKPKPPVILILGGAKIATKIPLIKFWQKKASAILLGGALANVFLKAKGLNIGSSLVDENFLSFAQKNFSKVILPIDFYALKNERKIYLSLKDLLKTKESDFKILDLGEETLDFYEKILKVGETIIWNGPLGLIEDERFTFSSLKLAQIIKSLKKFTVIGGGETLSLFPSKKDDHIFYSTGGGAMLEFLASKKLPALKVLGL